MRRDIHRRLAALAARQHVGTPEIDVWINKGDGFVWSRDGEAMTEAAFHAAFPNAMKMTLDIGDISRHHRMPDATRNDD